MWMECFCVDIKANYFKKVSWVLDKIRIFQAYLVFQTYLFGILVLKLVKLWITNMKMFVLLKQKQRDQMFFGFWRFELQKSFHNKLFEIVLDFQLWW